MALFTRLAHTALGAPFIALGYSAAVTPGARVNAAANLGIPNPEQAVRLNGAAMVAGGAGLCLGVFPRVSALVLAAAMVPTTAAGHPFWKETEPGPRQAQRIQFLKNLGLTGGLLAAALAKK